LGRIKAFADGFHPTGRWDDLIPFALGSLLHALCLLKKHHTGGSRKSLSDYPLKITDNGELKHGNQTAVNGVLITNQGLTPKVVYMKRD